MMVYKMLRPVEWAELEATGIFVGSADDLRDGFIHLSAADQVATTAAKYFSDTPVMLITLDGEALGPALRWEPSRGGALFPHLYRALRREEVVSATPYDGRKDLPQAP